MKIAIASFGYEGLSNALLSAQHHEVVALDIFPDKVAQLNNKQPPIEDIEIQVIVYEPRLSEAAFFRSRVVNDLVQFKKEVDVIVANRMTDDLQDVAAKTYTSDLFSQD